MIHSGMNTMKQRHCYNTHRTSCEFRPGQFRSVSAEPLGTIRGKVSFHGTTVEKHCTRLMVADRKRSLIGFAITPTFFYSPLQLNEQPDWRQQRETAASHTGSYRLQNAPFNVSFILQSRAIWKTWAHAYNNDCGDLHGFHSGIREAISVQLRKKCPLLTADGALVFDTSAQLHCWADRYCSIYSQPAHVNCSALSSQQQLPLLQELDSHFTMEDARCDTCNKRSQEQEIYWARCHSSRDFEKWWQTSANGAFPHIHELLE